MNETKNSNFDTASRQHRLTFESYALITENAPDLGRKLDEWYDFYRPATPGERQSVDMSVMSALQLGRVHECLTETINQQIRTAVFDFDCAQEDEVQRYRDMLPTRPGAALLGLKRSALGVRFLIQRWERLLNMIHEENSWYGNDRDEVINLQGARAGSPENLFASEGAYMTWIFCLMSRPRESVKDQDFIDLGQEHVMPRSIRDRKTEHWLPLPDHCRRLLEELAERQLAALRPRAEYLRKNVEEPARDGAEIRRQVLAGAAGALFLRYYRTYESQYHRSYQSFLKGRKETARSGLLPGQPIADIHGAPAGPAATDLPEPTSDAASQGRARRKQGADAVAPGGNNDIGAPIVAGDDFRKAVVATGITAEMIAAARQAEREETARRSAEEPSLAATDRVEEEKPGFPGFRPGMIRT